MLALAATTLVVCAPGYPGNTAEAQPAMDSLARALARATHSPEGSFTAVYEETAAGGVQRLQQKESALLLATLPFYLAHEQELGLVARLSAMPQSGETLERWTLVTAKARPRSLPWTSTPSRGRSQPVGAHGERRRFAGLLRRLRAGVAQAAAAGDDRRCSGRRRGAASRRCRRRLGAARRAGTSRGRRGSLSAGGARGSAQPRLVRRRNPGQSVSHRTGEGRRPALPPRRDRGARRPALRGKRPRCRRVRLLARRCPGPAGPAARP